MARTKIDSIVRTGAQTVVSRRFQLPDADPGRARPRRVAGAHHAPGGSPGEPMNHVRAHSTRRSTRRWRMPSCNWPSTRATGRLIDHRQHAVAGAALPDYQELRTEANAIKKHTIDNLDYYLEQFEAQRGGARRQGGLLPGRHRGRRFRARAGEGARRASDREIEIHDHRGDRFQRAAGASRLEAVETDLGEYILQLAHQRPYHIVAPALHMTRYDVADLFAQARWAWRTRRCIEKQTQIARAVLRAEISGGRYRRQRREFPGRRFGRGGAGGKRRQRAADHFRAEDSHRGGGHREADSARAGSGACS